MSRIVCCKAMFVFTIKKQWLYTIIKEIKYICCKIYRMEKGTRGYSDMEYLITQDMIISDDSRIIDSLKYMGFSEISLDEIRKFILNEENTKFYIDKNLSLKNENDKDITYVWLDTGCRKESGDTMFISLINKHGYFEGNFVGTPWQLSKKMKERYPNNQKQIENNLERFKLKYEKRISKREKKYIYLAEDGVVNENKKEKIVEHEGDISQQLQGLGFDISKDNENKEGNAISIPSVISPVSEEVYGQLLFNNWNSLEGLDRYIKVIGCRLVQLIEQNKSDYYILNKIKSAIVNTGLMNHFGVDLMIMYRFNVKYNTYDAYKIIYGKSDYIKNDFSREQTEQLIKPISFFDEEDVFEASLNDFDINYHNLAHIIQERRDRFPEEIREISDHQMTQSIQNALERGIKMQHRDKSYVKATYSAKNGKISWLMPFHITADFTSEPELVLVIRKNGEFYEIKTILPYDNEMKDKITALSLYSSLW